jgi:ATP-dependent RNA helicase DHX37/DHR1
VLISPAEVPLETEDFDLGMKKDDYQDYDGSDSEDSIIYSLDGEEEDKGEFDIGEEAAEEAVIKVHVLPLYSQLPTNQQLRVFDPINPWAIRLGANRFIGAPCGLKDRGLIDLIFP